MRKEIRWGFALNLKSEENCDIETLKFYFGETFELDCESKEFSKSDIFEICVCGKIWVNLNSDADFHRKEREISRKTAECFKSNLDEFGSKILYSGLIRERVFETSEVFNDCKVLDVSVDRIVKCYKKPAGEIYMQNAVIKYDVTGFESSEVCPFVEMTDKKVR